MTICAFVVSGEPISGRAASPALQEPNFFIWPGLQIALGNISATNKRGIIRKRNWSSRNSSCLRGHRLVRLFVRVVVARDGGTQTAPRLLCATPRVWFAAIVGNRSQTSRAAAFDFIRRKRWMKHDVATRNRALRKHFLLRALVPTLDPSMLGAGKQRGAQQAASSANLRGVTLGRALLHHIRGETGEARLSTIRAASRIETRSTATTGQSGPVVVTTVSISSLNISGTGRFSCGVGPACGEFATPRRFRVDGLASLFLPFTCVLGVGTSGPRSGLPGSRTRRRGRWALVAPEQTRGSTPPFAFR